MSKKYKVWIEIEEITTEDGVEVDYSDVEDFSINCGEFYFLEDAVLAIELMLGRSLSPDERPTPT